MTTYNVLAGHVLDRLFEIEAETVQAVITSPPYWGLRDYDLPPVVWHADALCEHDWRLESGRVTGGAERSAQSLWPTGPAPEGQSERATCARCGAWRGGLGQEPLPDCLGWAQDEECARCYVCHMRRVVRHLKRVLRPDGVLWLVLGDSYMGSWGNYAPGSQRQEDFGGARWERAAYAGRRDWRPVTSLPIPGLKPKDLVGIPWRVALALQADGWYLRSEVIWHKPNAMPESAADRCARDHEHVFMLTRQPKYFFDDYPIRLPHKQLVERPDKLRRVEEGRDYEMLPDSKKRAGQYAKGSNLRKSFLPGGRRRRTVWTVPTRQHDVPHFATYPEALVEPMILASTSAYGQCVECGAPWRRVVSGTVSKPEVSWEPGCECGADVEPQIVLDPFVGTGTTGVVARRLGRRFIGIELKEEWARLAEERIGHAQVPLFAGGLH